MKPAWWIKDIAGRSRLPLSQNTELLIWSCGAPDASGHRAYAIQFSSGISTKEFASEADARDYGIASVRKALAEALSCLEYLG